LGRQEDATAGQNQTGQLQHRKPHRIPQTAEALRPGCKVILVWDHLPAHRSQAMKRFLYEQRDWLSIDWLPGYAPDLNPIEGVWNNIKGRELANFCADQIEEASSAFRNGLRRVAHTLHLPFSFLRHAGLSF
jgi:putative transposase